MRSACRTACSCRDLPPYDTRARLRVDTGRAAALAREAVDIVCSAQGAASFGESNPLQRIWRDIEAGSRHAVLDPTWPPRSTAHPCSASVARCPRWSRGRMRQLFQPWMRTASGDIGGIGDVGLECPRRSWCGARPPPP
ncbi:hypothetical protein [Streptomyces alfalfae]